MYMIVGTLATKSFLAKDPYIVGLGLGNAQNVLGYLWNVLEFQSLDILNYTVQYRCVQVTFEYSDFPRMKFHSRDVEEVDRYTLYV